MICPLLRSAAVWPKPAAMSTTPLSPTGTLHWPSAFRPQQATAPSVRSAAECSPPAATFEALTTLEGTRVCPELLRPQAATDPSRRMAMLWAPFESTERTVPTVSGRTSSPLELIPHDAVRPSAAHGAASAHATPAPASSRDHDASMTCRPVTRAGPNSLCSAIQILLMGFVEICRPSAPMSSDCSD